MSLTVSQRAVWRATEDRARYLVADSSDDAASLSAKLVDVDNHRVVIVIPDDNHAMDSPVALRVLVRAAERSAINLAIVSRRRSLRRLAAIEGITTFASLSAIPQREGEAEPVAGPLRSTLANAFGVVLSNVSLAVAVGLVFSILLVAGLVIPRAIVYVRPVTDRLSGTIKIQASADTTTTDPTKGLIPGRVVYLVVDTNGTIPVESKDHPLDGRAVGFITFENRVEHPVTVPAGTVISTFSGVHFQTTRTIVLTGHAGASAQVPIVATAPGEYANVQRGQITVISGPLRWLVVAVNEGPIAGGGPAGVPVVTSWETSKLLDQVLASARGTAEQRLNQQVTGDEFAVPEAIEISPIEETFNHQVGEKAGSLAVHVQSRVKALLVSRRDVDGVAIEMWHPTVRPEFSLQANSVRIGTPIVTHVDVSTIAFDVPVQAVAYADINEQRVASYVRLRSPDAAEKDLSHLLDLASPPRIEIVPNWIPRVYRVQVIVDANSPPASSAAASR